MNVLSLFSGIGGFDLGFERAGMKTVAHCEIDKDAAACFARHFPDSKHYEDIKKFGATPYRGSIDVVCGGFPCQDLSVAGKRAGLGGGRSGLFYELARILDEARPRVFVLENVPGLLSSNEGRDMAAVIGTLAGLGYLGAYAVLDSQYFGVAQRRRRVFLVGCSGADGARKAAEILALTEGLSGHPAPSRKAREDIAEVSGTLSANGGGTNRPAGNANELDFCVAVTDLQQVTSKVNGLSDDPSRGAPTLSHNSRLAVAIHPHCIGRSPNAGPQGKEYLQDGSAYTMDTKAPQAVCHAVSTGQGRIKGPDHQTYIPMAFGWNKSEHQTMSVDETTDALQASPTSNPAVYDQYAVRRLTPVECERLQGFPDGWTEGFADTPRYRMLGNAVTVPVAEWIGRRIMERCGEGCAAG